MTLAEQTRVAREFRKVAKLLRLREQEAWELSQAAEEPYWRAVRMVAAEIYGEMARHLERLGRKIDDPFAPEDNT